MITLTPMAKRWLDGDLGRQSFALFFSRPPEDDAPEDPFDWEVHEVRDRPKNGAGGES